MEDDCLRKKDDTEKEDDFWRHPLRYVSLGETPDPTKKVGPVLLSRGSQEDARNALVPDQYLSSTNTLEDEVFEDDQQGSTEEQHNQVGLNHFTHRGPFVNLLAECVKDSEEELCGLKDSEAGVDSSRHVDGHVDDGGRMVDVTRTPPQTDPSGGRIMQQPGKRLSFLNNTILCLETAASPTLVVRDAMSYPLPHPDVTLSPHGPTDSGCQEGEGAIDDKFTLEESQGPPLGPPMVMPEPKKKDLTLPPPQGCLKDWRRET